jgi:hypothetical protein
MAECEKPAPPLNEMRKVVITGDPLSGMWINESPEDVAIDELHLGGMHTTQMSVKAILWANRVQRENVALRELMRRKQLNSRKKARP